MVDVKDGIKEEEEREGVMRRITILTQNEMSHCMC